MALTTHCGPWACMPPLVRVGGFLDVQETLVKALSKATMCVEATQKRSTRTALPRSSPPP
eukprot:4881718-Alexandrium_andersonii.AAC.1